MIASVRDEIVRRLDDGESINCVARSLRLARSTIARARDHVADNPYGRATDRAIMDARLPYDRDPLAQVLVAEFGPMSRESVALLLGCSNENVRQIEERAFAKLREVRTLAATHVELASRDATHHALDGTQGDSE